MRIGRLPTIAFALAVLITGMPLQAVQASHLSGTLLPDLGMAKTRKFSIDTSVPGQKRLRFTTIIVNIGDGPFQLHGHSPQPNGDLLIEQQIAASNGTWASEATNFRMYFAGDGHTHWHVRDLATYELRSTTTLLGTGEKHGFCFFDNFKFDLGLPDAPSSTVYPRDSCGEASDTSITTGLSIGWGDKYVYRLPDQYINITGLPSGDYTLTATVDAQGFLRERCEGNNTTTAILRITSNSVTVVNAGKNAKPCPR